MDDLRNIAIPTDPEEALAAVVALRRLADRIERATPRQALHAAALAFRHPATGQELEFRAEWPADLMPALRLAAGSEVVAPQEALTYLQFYERDA